MTVLLLSTPIAKILPQIRNPSLTAKYSNKDSNGNINVKYLNISRNGKWKFWSIDAVGM